jgi:hypothetical protein
MQVARSRRKTGNLNESEINCRLRLIAEGAVIGHCVRRVALEADCAYKGG